MASKADLTKATEKANASIKGLNEVAERATSGVIKSKSAKKPNSDYLRFDLRPSGGKDYKTYIEEQARKESVKQGVTISATKYLHALIDKDMESRKNTKRTTKTEITDLLNNLDEQKLKTIHIIVKELCK